MIAMATLQAHLWMPLPIVYRGPLRQNPHSSTTSALKNGYREARHFAGGMIRHPSESTNHYSILRHSHGLVFYQGTSTSIAISVFADTPIPQNRKFWLKPKSWSGSPKNKATFSQQTDELLDVTPTTKAKMEQIGPSDERAWQRDIMQFERRSLRGPRSEHFLRETDVIRIPSDAGDGYFQIVLCAGDNEEILCISPVFRILSVSPSMGGVSGANWATLPLEVGAMALSLQAKKTVGAAIVPVKMAAKSKTQPYVPPHTARVREAGKLAIGATGAAKVGAQIHDFNRSIDEERQELFNPDFETYDEYDYDEGPKTPYPICFKARCSLDSSVVTESHILPMMELVDVPDITTYRLCGYYFGWCSPPPERIEKHGHIKERHHWFQAVIIVSPVDVETLDKVTMSSANRKQFKIQILGDSHDQPSHDAELQIKILGGIRPWDQELEKMIVDDMQADEEVAFETTLANEMSDIGKAQEILNHSAWGLDAGAKPDGDAEAKNKAHGIDKVKQQYAEKRHAVQKKIDRVPLHKLGVRMPIDRMKERSILVNGYYIER